jgi:RNA methyltransferase, TrmH family
MGNPELTSLRSPRVSAARRLAKRAFRTADGRFLAEGPQAVREAAAVPGVLIDVFATADAAARYADILDSCRRAGASVALVSGGVMASIAQTITPQGIAAVCRRVDVSLDAALSPGRTPRLITVLVNARDPGNTGTVIRTADAAGADAVLLTDASVDPYNGKCVRATAGSIFHLPIVLAGPSEQAIDRLKAAGLAVLAADGAGDVDLDEALDRQQLARPTAWLFGNEAWGLPAEIRTLADLVIRVPIHGRAESLNLATAAAVCLYASARAHRRGSQAALP